MDELLHRKRVYTPRPWQDFQKDIVNLNCGQFDYDRHFLLAADLPVFHELLDFRSILQGLLL